MSERIDIGNVRGIQGERGEKGDRGRTPTYEDIRYKKDNNDKYITIKTDYSISPTNLYLDVNGNLCNSEGYLLDENLDPTDVQGEPFDMDKYGYDYERLYIDTEGNYTNVNGELLDENYKIQYVVSDFISDMIAFLFKDERAYDTMLRDIYMSIADILISAEHQNDPDYQAFLEEIEGDIKYYLCADNPYSSIYYDDEDELVNTCKYYDDGELVMDGNDYAIVPLQKNALYLYNANGYHDNDIMHYDIYLCLKYNTVPIKIVSASDFVMTYNTIDDLNIVTEDEDEDDENEVYLKIGLRGGSGMVYTTAEVDTLFANNVINKLGANNGIAQLNGSGKVPSSQLPAFVDEVVEGTMNNGETVFTNSNNEVETGASGKIYVDTETRKTYRWTGSAYIFISNPIVVSDGSTTAYSSTDGGALETLIGNSTLDTTAQTITGAVNELYSDKLNKTHTDYKGMNVVVDSTTGDITFENKPNVPTDVSDLTDNNSLIPSDVSDLNDVSDTAFTPKPHDHVMSDITDLDIPTDVADLTDSTGIIPTDVADLTDSSNTQFTPKSHTHTESEISDLGNYLTQHQDISGKLNIAQTSYKGKNVVVDETSGNITFEEKFKGKGYIDDDFNLYVVDISKGINLEASKDIIQSGDTVKIYGFSDVNNSLDLYKGNTKITTMSLTDGVGFYTYTGVGAGKTSFYVESGSSQSETYTIKDCQFLETGLDNTYASNWYNYSQFTITNDSSGMNVSSSSQSYLLANKPGTGSSTWASTRDWGIGQTVEVDIVSVTGTVNLICTGNNQSITESGHITVQITQDNSQCGFQIYADSSVKFKNFIIY